MFCVYDFCVSVVLLFMIRLRVPYSGNCKVSVNHACILHPDIVVDNDYFSSVEKFVSQYTSHLYSSHLSVDPDRLSALSSFMSKFQ